MYKYIAKIIFNEYLTNIEICSEQGIEKDGMILAKLIVLKYGGEDMVEVLKQIYKKIYEKNHFITTSIDIKAEVDD